VILAHPDRNLGDLSGGQILARVLTRTYGMTEGLRFFDFEQIPKPKPYKDVYRERLDALPLTDGEQQRVVREAQLAFDLNTALFAALDEAHV
jgi:heme oxygenase